LRGRGGGRGRGRGYRGGYRGGHRRYMERGNRGRSNSMNSSTSVYTSEDEKELK